MNGLMSAIKNRRGGGMLNEESAGEEMEMSAAPKAPQQNEAQGLKALMGSLDDGQKQMLLKMLSADQKITTEPDAIQKGAKGPGETMELEEYVSENEPEEGHESEDEIMESMISSADRTRVDRGIEPRNLGERVKMSLANKLKKKG